MNLETWYEHLWLNYVQMTPRVSKIRDMFLARGERIENDHIAFRTLDLAPISIANLEPILFDLGYRAFDDYVFEEKKLTARSYIKDGSPRIFLSELQCAQFPEFMSFFQSLVNGIQSSVSPELFWAGRLWPAISHSEYLRVREATEYGAWFAALGLRPNHFTVSVNHLKTFEGIQEVSEWIAASGFAMNTSGGLIKGTPQDLLEQSSTLADQIPVEFQDGLFEIPTCYYEFALRHPKDGALFDGFVTKSADRIFESTAKT